MSPMLAIPLCWGYGAKLILGHDNAFGMRKMISENVVFSLGTNELLQPPELEQEWVRALIKQSQELLLLVISEGHTADELVESKHLFPALDREVYKSAMGKIIGISLSSPNPDYKTIVTWAAETLSRGDRQLINKHMDDFYVGYLLKFPELQQRPLDDYAIYESKEFLDIYQVFHQIDEQKNLMDYVIADDPKMVDRIAGALREDKRDLQKVYLQLQKYEGTHKVRQSIHGTLEMSFSEIHEKLVGMFSVDGRTNAQQGIGVTFNTVWDAGLTKHPKVIAYIERSGFEFLLDLTSLALRPRNLIEAHFEAHHASQCELMSEIVRKINLSTRQAAQLFYCGVLEKGAGKVMDLEELGESGFLTELAVDLCNYEDPKVLYLNSMASELLKSLPMEKIIRQVCKFEDERADYVLARLYEKTSDKSILTRLKSNAVKGKVFTLELGV